MHEWACGSSLERRTAAAALCEPALLTTPERVGEAPAVLVEATTGIAEAGADERRSEEFRALRKGLAMLRMTNKRSGSTRAAHEHVHA
jgi:hypothetical protein